MAIRSMTGFAQIKGQQGKTAYTFTAKSVNHRFLDLHLRLPGRSELFEQQLAQAFQGEDAPRTRGADADPGVRRGFRASA